MSVQKLLDHFGIQPTSLEAIKKRVFIVGRFNTAQSSPSIYLFSKSNRVDPRFDGSRSLSYSSFIDLIRPTLTENFGEEAFAPGEVLPFFTLSPQQMNQNKGDASYVIDPFNYFFLRAISSSEHEHFKARNNSRAPIKNLLKDLPGETIYKQIRSSLKEFCSTQSKNFDIIRAFAQLLAKNAGKGGLPANLADGTEFPVNFLPVFIDYLYQEGPDPFNIDQTVVDFNSHFVWQTAMGNRRELFITNLQKLVTAFKYYLLDPSSIKNEHIPGLDLVTYLNPENGLVKEELRKKFATSRESYNMLRQIIRSRVLLSMVLQWAINSFQELPSAKAASEGIEKNETIERAINEGLDGLAKPASNLAEGVNTGDLITDFKSSFPVLLEHIVDPNNPKNQAAFKRLSTFIQNIGIAILKDEQKTENVRMMMSMPSEQRKVMVRALENFFTDVIIPRFFKEPGLTEKELLDKYNEYELDLFITSSILEIANSSNVENFFSLDKDSKEQLLGSLIGGMIEFLIQPEVQKSVTRARLTLENYNTLRRLGFAESPEIGIGQHMALLPPTEARNTDSVIGSLSKSSIKKLTLELPNTQTKIRALTASHAVEPGQNQKKHITENLTKSRELISVEASKNDSPSSTDSNAAVAPLQQQGNQELVSAPTNTFIQDSENNLQAALQKYVNSLPTDKLTVQQQIEKIIKEDVKVYHTNLSKIYERYAEATQLPSFKNKVEALTLSRLLLLHKKELNLDKAGTNLFDLLLDMVEKLDAEKPDLKDFFSNNSLTKYLKKDIFKHDGFGFTALLSVLENQAETSLQNVVQYVSELQGVKYLFDVVKDKGSDGEIIVINATHHEFINWLQLPENNLLMPSGLANSNIGNPQFPSLVFMTDLAFNADGSSNTEVEKANFLRSLQPPNVFQNTDICIPPICMATPDIDPNKKEEWRNAGERLSQAANDTIAPVMILGPSLPLNSNQDKLFRTTLSSGYIFCSHLLTGAEQNLGIKNITAKPLDRFRNIGYGVFGVYQTIKNMIEAADEINEDYSFAADYYIYLISLLFRSIKYSGKPYPDTLSSRDFWKCFYYDETSPNTHRSSGILDKVMIYKKMTDWSFTDQINDNKDLTGVKLFLNERKSDYKLFQQVQWFTNF